MKKVIPYLFVFVLGFVAASLFTCGDKPKDNSTDNVKSATDTAEIIEQAVAPLKAEVSQKEVIIADYRRTVAELEAMSDKGNQLAGQLAYRLKKAENALKSKGIEIDRLTLLLSETRATATTGITEVARNEEGVGVEIGGNELPPIYEAEALEPGGWYKINATFDTYADTAKFSLLVRNDFEVSEFQEGGVAKMRVTNRNPYTYSLPGSNVFDLKPTIAPVQKKRRLGFGLTVGAFAIRDFDKDLHLGYGGGLGLFYRLL